MQARTNIGQWTAEIDNGNKTPNITVDGTFPTNGEKPLYNLIKNEPQGTNPTELLLTLNFGTLADPKGSVNFFVTYNEAISTVEQYKTVQVVDEDGRTIANIDVKLKTKSED
jgi:hypothetical protein